MKHTNKLFSILLMCVCLIGFSSSIVVNATEKHYEIPKYEDFNPNKAADDIEATVNSKSVICIEAVDNKVFVDGAEVLRMHEKTVEEMNGYISKLNKNGMYLNREPINTVTVRIKNVNFSEFAEISINAENLNLLANINNLKIILRNKNEYIALNREDIAVITASRNHFKVQIKKQSDTYILRFLDADNNIIDKYNADIKVGLPAKHSEQTVYLFADNTWENWGGQYNESEQSIEFMTKYSGEYNVASPEIVITDTDNLTDYENRAVRFMVVRGYFGLENQKFNPDAFLTRYDFAEALVRMFFAMDNDAVCSFPDVDKKYYRYVAASQQDNIVQGFEDGTFKGNENVTAEQVIALTARTINQKNGYVYPENINKYLNFTENNVIEEWAKKEVALAIREGIYSADMNLKFAEDISRKNAAVILYRLFMIMNNTPKPSETPVNNINNHIAHETVWNKTNAIIAFSSAVTVNVTALALSVLFIKRKRKR